MRNRNPRRFRHRSNGRNYSVRNNETDQVRLGAISFSNGRGRNNFKPQHSAEKLVEKYNALAKEALSTGDRILSENYFQHADHFVRIIDNRNLNQNQNPTQVTDNTQASNLNSDENIKINQDQSVKKKE